MEENITNVYLNLIKSNEILFNDVINTINIWTNPSNWNIHYLFDINAEKQAWLVIQFFGWYSQLWKNVVIEFDTDTQSATIIESNYTSSDGYWNKYINCSRYSNYQLWTAIKAWEYYYIGWNKFRLIDWKLSYQSSYYSSSIEQRLATIYYHPEHFDINNLQSQTRRIRKIDKIQLNNWTFEFISDDALDYFTDFDRRINFNFWFWTLNDGYNIYMQPEEWEPEKAKFALLHNALNNSNAQSKIWIISRDDSIENPIPYTTSYRPEISLVDSANEIFLWRMIYWDRLVAKSVPYNSNNARQISFIWRYADYKYIFSLWGWYFFVWKYLFENLWNNQRSSQLTYDVIYLSETYQSDDVTWTFIDTRAINLQRWIDSFNAKIEWIWLRYNVNYRLYYKLNNAENYKLITDITKVQDLTTDSNYLANSNNNFYYKIEMRQIQWQMSKIQKTQFAFFWNISN